MAGQVSAGADAYDIAVDVITPSDQRGELDSWTELLASMDASLRAAIANDPALASAHILLALALETRGARPIKVKLDTSNAR